MPKQAGSALPSSGMYSATAPEVSAENSLRQLSRNRSKGGFERVQAVASGESGFIASLCATQSGHAQPVRHHGLPPDQQQGEQNRGDEDGEAEQRHLHSR